MKKKTTISVLFISILLALGVMVYSYQYSDVEELPQPTPRSWSEIVQSDTLRAITLETSFTAFMYKDKWRGYEYETARQMCDSLGLNLKIILAKSEKAMIDSLFSGSADVAIWPASKSIWQNYYYLQSCGPYWQDEQVIVSARKLKPIASPDSTKKARYHLAISLDTRQWLVYNNDSVRAHFDFSSYALDTIPHDSLSSEALCDAMMKGGYDAVMLRNNVAKLMKAYYPTLKISNPIPFSADSVHWLVSKGADTLIQKIDSVCQFSGKTPQYSVQLKRIYDQVKNSGQRRRHRIRYQTPDGCLSPFDTYFRKYAAEIGWDWRLVASIAYIESKFDPTQIGAGGASGLMQIMPASVSRLGVDAEELMDPETAVRVACMIISRMEGLLMKKFPEIKDEDKRMLLLAAYNAGYGHVSKAIDRADSLGYDVMVYQNNVEHCIKRFTVNYVFNVLSVYEDFCEKIEQ